MSSSVILLANLVLVYWLQFHGLPIAFSVTKEEFLYEILMVFAHLNTHVEGWAVAEMNTCFAIYQHIIPTFTFSYLPLLSFH